MTGPSLLHVSRAGHAWGHCNRSRSRCVMTSGEAPLCYHPCLESTGATAPNDVPVDDFSAPSGRKQLQYQITSELARHVTGDGCLMRFFTQHRLNSGTQKTIDAGHWTMTYLQAGCKALAKPMANWSMFADTHEDVPRSYRSRLGGRDPPGQPWLPDFVAERHC